MQEKREIVRTSDSLSLGHFLGEPSLVSPATRGGGLIFTTGYVAMNPDTGKPETGSIEVETRRTLDNLKMVLETAGSSFDKVLKINIFMEDLDEWPAMNEVYVTYFPKNKPARSAFAGSGLALNARCEIEVIATVD